MEKAYEGKALLDKLKGKGFDLAEDAAAVLVVSMLEWVEESAKMSENKYDDLFIAVAPMMKAEILKLVDQIDGVEG